MERVERVERVEPSVIRLGVGSISVGVVPTLGGRMLSLRAAGREFLWRDAELIDEALNPRVARAELVGSSGFADWQNWGGDKSWVAPQGWGDPERWPGPPDAVFDAGAFRILSLDDARVVLSSGFDERTGLRMTRDIAVSRQSVSVTTTLCNESGRPRRWAAWEVAQLAFGAEDVASADAGIRVSTARGETPRVLVAGLGTIDTLRLGKPWLLVPFADVVGKLGFADSTGLVELHYADGSAMRLDFTVDHGADYPDDCPFQLWMQTPVTDSLPGLDGLAPTARLVELEPTSPLTTLAPGESVSLRAVWTPSV